MIGDKAEMGFLTDRAEGPCSQRKPAREPWNKGGSKTSLLASGGGGDRGWRFQIDETRAKAPRRRHGRLEVVAGRSA